MKLCNLPQEVSLRSVFFRISYFPVPVSIGAALLFGFINGCVISIYRFAKDISLLLNFAPLLVIQYVTLAFAGSIVALATYLLLLTRKVYPAVALPISMVLSAVIPFCVFLNLGDFLNRAMSAHRTLHQIVMLIMPAICAYGVAGLIGGTAALLTFRKLSSIQQSFRTEPAQVEDWVIQATRIEKKS